MSLINIVEAGPMADAEPISNIFDRIASFATSLIAGIAILVIVVAGIMYLMSEGNTAKAETAKKALIAGVVGLVVALFAFVLVGLISNFA